MAVDEPGVSGERVVRRPDAVLRGEAVGAGPTVLLLHAGGERRQVWAPVMDVLVGAGFRCVAFDQRGHGDSGGAATSLGPFAGDVAAMVGAEPPGCVVVGASLGGLAAIAALGEAQVRARVSALVLVDVVPDPEPDRVRRFLSARGMLDARSDLVDDVLSQNPRRREIVAELDLPILLVCGGPASALGDQDVDRLLQIARQATVIRIAGAGHLVARDEPVALGEAIAAFAVPWPARALQRELGAGGVDHPGGNLLDHLERVHELVVGWGGGRRLQRAALCHATYGTDGFPRPLLPLDQRTRLRAAIGDEAERLVYLYDACDRAETYAHLGATPLPLTDRFTGEVVPLAGADLTDFAVLTVANELDIARTAPLSTSDRDAIRTLITALTPHAPTITPQALADPSLA